MGTKILGDSGQLADVAGTKQLKVIPETNSVANIANIGLMRMVSENDPGCSVQPAQLMSPETDLDYRQREASDTMLDDEQFNYAAQNTGKHTFLNTTMAAAWAANGLQTNSTGITTLNTGLTFGSYRMFPVIGANVLSLDAELAFSAVVPSNTIVDIGLFLRGASTPYAPLDGVFIRATSSGIRGYVNYNGVENSTPLFYVPTTDPNVVPSVLWAPTVGRNFQMIVYVSPRMVEFWINDAGIVFLAGVIQTPSGNGSPCQSAALPFSIRHAIGASAASAALSVYITHYSVRLGGAQIADQLGAIENRLYGSYQGLSGGTMGALQSGTVITGTLVAPTAAVPLNASLAANLCNSLSGRSYETFTSALALNVDGLLQQYQVPAGSVAVQGRTLKIKGVKLSAWIQAVMVGGTAIINEFQLAWGNTAASMQTAEAAATKKPRRVFLPELTELIAVTQAVTTQVAQPGGFVCNFSEPIYVNPGEFVELIITHQGTTIPTAGVVAYDIQFDYSWE